MFHLNSFVNEVKDIGRQMAEKINEPFDEECLYIHPFDEGEMSIQYWGHKKNAEVVIEMANLNEITYYDPDDIEEIEGD